MSNPTPSPIITAEVNRNFLKFMVSRTIFCPISGQILDMRDAVYCGGEGVRPVVVTAAVWDERKDAVLAALAGADLTPKIIDGREIF